MKNNEVETMVELPELECPKCKHKWTPRVKNPEKCPNCGLKLNQINRGETE